MFPVVSPVMTLIFEFLNAEVNPQFANIVSPSEVVVISSFHVEIEGGGGDFHITLPYSMLEPMREILDAGVQSDRHDADTRWVDAMTEDVKTADVALTCTLTNADLDLRQVVDLKKGDIIPVEIPDLITMAAEGVPIFRGKYGIANGNAAVKVVEQVSIPKIESQLVEVTS